MKEGNIIAEGLLDRALPTFGTTKEICPIWDEGQKMFICGGYESASGHLYYMGVRFCDRIVIVEKVGLYHNWTYIDGIDIYAFNGTKLELVQKRDYEKTFRNEEFIREESKRMVRDYIKGVAKVQGSYIAPEEIDQKVAGVIESCYTSFLDSDFNVRQIGRILPQLEQH